MSIIGPFTGVNWVVTLALSFALVQQAVFPEPIRVMPMGDSITWGYDTPGGYRVHLWNAWRGVQLDFVGSQTANSAAGLPDPQHEGYGGFTTANLRVFAAARIVAYRPHIVLLLAGTNDIASGVGWQAAFTSFTELWTTMINADPNVVLYVGTLTLRTDGWWNLCQIYNSALRNWAIGKPRTILVELEYILQPQDLWDTVHPNASGYLKLGNAWAAAIRKRVPYR